MKTKFGIIFLIGGFAGLLLASPLLVAVGFAGFLFSKMEFKQSKSGAAFLQIVPGKFMVPRANPQNEEVPYMSRAEKALYDQLVTLGRSNPVTQKAITEGAISFDPISYYIRFTITGLSGRQKILGSNTLINTGITNFPNGAVLPQYYNFCFDRIAVRYAVTASASANAAAVTGFSSVRGSMPAALGNGEIVISSNRNTIVETPIADFTSVAAITGGGERDYDGGILEKPRFFLELLQIECELNLATGQSVPSAANNTYTVEVMFYGVQARLKY